MQVVKCSYNSESDNLLALEKEFEDIEFEFYDSNHYKERKKAILLKAGYGTKLDPFLVVLEDKEPLRAFYSDVNECTYDNIKAYLNEIHNN